MTAVRDRSKWISPETGEKMYCASSYAVATAEVLEGYYLKTKGKLVPLSVQQISDCSSNESIMSLTGTGQWNYGCAGGFLENSFNYASEYEVYDEETYKYLGMDSQCNTKSLKPKARAKFTKGWARPRSFDPHAVKKELIKGPVAASISASSPIFKFYAMGIIDDLALSGHSHMICAGKINHAVTIVGWGRELSFEKDYFIIKNSFGTDWGQDGFAKISVDNNEQNKSGSCGILSSVYAIFE